ncbi:GerMN domain-containing protein [Thermovenabulum sp.]|uniref:GerMN domain-containing protein n=1 Tax=Thermovenabulum sp. TaxID=3100335 RepID=UPI003C7D8C34
MPKKLIAGLLILLLLVSLTGCNILTFLKKEDSNKEEAIQGKSEDLRKTVLYYVNENNLLVPVTKSIPRVEGIAKAAIENLIDREEIRTQLSDKGLKPTLPENTRILGMTIKDGVARVDFCKEFLNFKDKMGEKIALLSLVYTLTEFPTINKVELMVEGKSIKKSTFGTKLDTPLQRENINLESEGQNINNMQKVTLYFRGTNKEGTFSYFVPVTRYVKNSNDLFKTALQELIKGPKPEMGLSSVIPKETKVLSVEKKDNEVIANFSKELENFGGGLENEQAVVNSIVLTLTSFKGVDRVTIQVEGEKTVLSEGTVLDTPILKPLYVNPESI